MSAILIVRRLLISLLLTVFILAGTGHSQPMMEHHPANIITTQGRGEASVNPDSLGVSIAVETQDKSLAEARSQNNAKMTAIINAVRALNIPGLEVETRSFNVYPVYDHRGNRMSGEVSGPPELTGFRVSNNIQVTVNNASREQLGEYATRILDTALAAGANQINSLNFYLENMAPAQALALREAVNSAQRNAEALAQAAGVTLSGVYSIEGYPQFHDGPRPMMMQSMSAERAVATPIEVGETTVSATATVRFRF